MDASRKTPKIKSVSGGGAISPIDTRLTADSTLIRYLRGRGSPITSSSSIGYRSGNEAFPSPISSSNSSRGSSSTFGRSSSSPLSAIENLISPPVYGTTPVKLVDEDVLIMDGFSVESSSGGRVSKSISSDSGGSSSNSASSSPGIRGYKTELCRPWEDTGQCRSGSKCQYAHGKEELRPYFFSVKNKSENYSPKSSTNAFSSYTPKSRFILPATAPSPTALPFRPEFKSQSQSPAIISTKNTGQMCLRKSPNFIKPELSKKSPIINIKFQDWLPSDDRIEVRLPGHINIPSSNGDVDSYIRNFLHGPSNRRRLPVFTEFCPR